MTSPIETFLYPGFAFLLLAIFARPSTDEDRGIRIGLVVAALTLLLLGLLGWALNHVVIR